MPRKNKIFLDFADALAHLQDENTTLSASALSALSGASKKDLNAFAQTWSHLSAARRRRAARMLVDLAEDNIELDFNLLFRHLFTDADAQVRTTGIEGLWEDEDAALVRPLVGFLRHDPDTRVRAAAADALGRFVLLAEYGCLAQMPHAEMISSALLDTIHDAAEDLAVRCRAVEALAYSSDAPVREVIAAAYEDDAPEMRASAVAAMGHSADAYWRETAARELESLDARMRLEAARAAGELEDRAAVPRLIELLDDPDREVQSAAITALGQVGGKMAQTALTQAAASDDEVLRELADEALQELEFSSNSEFLLLDIQTDENLDDEEWEEDIEE